MRRTVDPEFSLLCFGSVYPSSRLPDSAFLEVRPSVALLPGREEASVTVGGALGLRGRARWHGCPDPLRNGGAVHGHADAQACQARPLPYGVMLDSYRDLNGTRAAGGPKRERRLAILLSYTTLAE